MSGIFRLIEVLGLSEDDAAQALVSASAKINFQNVHTSWKNNRRTGHSAPSAKDLREITRAAKYSCVKCGSSFRLTFDHVNGNPTDHAVDNLQLLCLHCNLAKSTEERGLAKPVRNMTGRAALATIAYHDLRGCLPSDKEVMVMIGEPGCKASLTGLEGLRFKLTGRIGRSRKYSPQEVDAVTATARDIASREARDRAPELPDVEAVLKSFENRLTGLSVPVRRRLVGGLRASALKGGVSYARCLKRFTSKMSELATE